MSITTATHYQYCGRLLCLWLADNRHGRCSKIINYNSDCDGKAQDYIFHLPKQTKCGSLRFEELLVEDSV